MKILFTLFLSLFVYANSYCQEPVSYVLISVTEKSEIKLDDGPINIIGKNEPYKIKSVPGQHLISAKSLETDKTFKTVFVLENGKQKLMNINYAAQNESIENKETPIIDIANIDISIPGIAKITATQGTYNSNDYEGYPTYYYALEQNDEIIFSVDTRSKSGKNEIRIVNYKKDSIIYFNDGFQSLQNLNFTIPERGIYYFQFRSKNALDRKATFILKRKPESVDGVGFNTGIEWKMVSDTVTISSQVDGKETTEQKIKFVEKAVMKHEQKNN
ncbi:MAG: hypothetical protein HKO56_08540 [Bacteroidia bacterium]|nr:hypothetical protein [Bacteroidia bacterium]NNM16692.1 hypothetical protein [Bacteroidia bacterium]